MTARRPPGVTEADLARLADGTLPSAREAEVRRQVADAPELSVALAEQRRVVDLLRTADDRAPASVRVALREATTHARWRPRPRRQAHLRRHSRPRRLRGPLAGVVVTAVTAAAALIALIGASPAAPSLAQATRLALSSPTRPGPPLNRTQPTELALHVGDLSFPRWPGWRATGARSDRLGGRSVQTVFYTNAAGRRVGYAIVSGTPLVSGTGRTPALAYASGYTLRRQGGARVVTWVQDGHTCILAGTAVGDGTLLALAQSAV